MIDVVEHISFCEIEYMSKTLTTITAVELFERCQTALAIAGLPEFQSVEFDDQTETLKFLPKPADDDDPTWAIVPTRGSSDDYDPVDIEMCLEILLSHFRNWLLRRGWQVQVHCYADLRRWTLVDCLSPADGGGDRLDVDYPYGGDELAVLVNSIIAVNTI